MIGITIRQQNVKCSCFLVILMIIFLFLRFLFCLVGSIWNIQFLFFVLFFVFRRFVGYVCYRKQFVDSTTTMYVSIYFVWRSLFVFLSISFYSPIITNFVFETKKTYISNSITQCVICCSTIESMNMSLNKPFNIDRVIDIYTIINELKKIVLNQKKTFKKNL